MSEHDRIEGIAAALPIANLDTDQLIPKQFLHGIDKSGLAQGLFHDLRFDGAGAPKPGFVLNRPEYQGTRILVAGANFGCGSSREHAVWSLQQYGIRAVIAPSYGEIFYSNAMNNRLLLVMLKEDEVQALLDEAGAGAGPLTIEIDVRSLTVRSPRLQASFAMSARYQRMFLEGLDMVGATLADRAGIDAFAAAHWRARPWMKDVARRTFDRLHHSQETNHV
jgi:3-isopropylmalate/(R)-2-methylmalate dehydratase small subunit